MIEVKGLTKIYGKTVAIRDIDFTVKAGEIIGFIGPNGAGKTTTMRILSGYIPATYGTALIAGYDVHQDSMSVRRSIGYLPENPPLYPDMTVEGFLHFVASIKGIARLSRSKYVQLAQERCQILDKRSTRIGNLSKGYRQRVGIAQAIVHDPQVIILDEPTVGLDPRQIIEVRNLIKSLAPAHTIILSSHLLAEVSMTCDRLIIINQGKVVATNTPDNLMNQVKGSFGYEIEVEGDLIPFQFLLTQIPGVSLVEIKERNHRSLLRITCKRDVEPGNEIASLVVRSGLALHEMRRTRPSLEDVFLKLTQEKSSLVKRT